MDMRVGFISSLMALALTLTLTPTVARAQHRGFQGHSFHGHSVRMGNVKFAGSIGVHPSRQPLPLRRPPFDGRRFRPLVPFALGYPGALYPPLDYYDTPVYYPPTAGAIPLNEPGPQSEPDVIQYPGGRYELRGDGVTRGYVWVWVPDPPSAPPAGSADPGARNSPPKPNLPEPKIITIPAPEVSHASSADPTEPRIITVPRQNMGSSTKR
jgi:hypothetical protein